MQSRERIEIEKIKNQVQDGRSQLLDEKQAVTEFQKYKDDFESQLEDNQLEKEETN